MAKLTGEVAAHNFHFPKAFAIVNLWNCRPHAFSLDGVWIISPGTVLVAQVR